MRTNEGEMSVKGKAPPAFSRHIDSPVLNSRFDINEPQTYNLVNN